jgi:peptide/nickel transport system permease protein
VWARVVYGSRVSLVVAVVSVAIYLTIGTAVGAASGFYGGWIDFTLQRLADILLAFPSILLILTFVTFTKPSMANLFLAIGLLNWPSAARLVRAEVLTLREREYITAARALGASNLEIIVRHILPGLLPLLLVTATFGIAEAILIESALSFLGVGVPPPAPTWGGMIRDAVSITILEQQPWLWLSPGTAIVAAVLAVNYVGDGLLAVFNLQQRRHL